jgi:hypothetical protein
MYWEIETDDSYTPGRIGDHIIIIKANSMEEALKLFSSNRGRSTLKGQPIVCKEIFYVKDDWS